MGSVHAGICAWKSEASVTAKQLVEEGCSRPPKTQQKDWRRNFNFLQSFCMGQRLHFRQHRIGRAGRRVQEPSAKTCTGTVAIDLAGESEPCIPCQSQSLLHLRLGTVPAKMLARGGTTIGHPLLRILHDDDAAVAANPEPQRTRVLDDIFSSRIEGPYFSARGDLDTGKAGNGPSVLAKEISSNKSDGLTQETTGRSLREERPMENSELIRGMSSSL